MTVNLRDNPENRKAEENTAKTVAEGFQDPTGNFPKTDYWFESSINTAARSKTINTLDVSGLDGTSVDLPPAGQSQYPMSRVNETVSGHIIEYDDTPGSEKILIKHRTGSGIELKADGSCVIKAENNMVTSISGSSVLIVEGETEIKCNGNLKLTVAGDLQLNVGGDILRTVGGNINEIVNGSSRELVYGTRGSVVKGNRSNTTLGTQTNLIMGGENHYVKGNKKEAVQGDYICGSSGTYKCTSEGKFVLSADDMNVGANSLSVFGNSGTIGGSGIVHYGKTSYATTFHGDLKGTAEKSVTSDITNSQTYGEASTGSALGYTVTNDTTATASANSTIMSEYLDKSANGIMKVTIDEGDNLKNMIDRTFDNGGVSSRTLNTRETRSRLRDDATMSNEKFVGTAISSGTVSNKIHQTVPPSQLYRISSKTGETRIPHEGILGSSIDRYKPNKALRASKFIPNPSYDLRALDASLPITPKIALGKGIYLSKFLGAAGDKVTLAHVSTRDERLLIAKQFSMHVDAINAMNNAQFKNHRLVVVEGLYKKESTETLTSGSLNDMATTGRVVVYELHDTFGKISQSKTFELATYWKDSIRFEKLILSYDNFNPDESITTQLILVMPKIDQDYNISSGNYANMIETQFNNKVQANELIQML